MSGNLPPGVTESMIPGNRPEDVEDERAAEALLHSLAELGVEPSDYALLGKLAAVLLPELRTRLDKTVTAARAEEREAAPCDWKEWQALKVAWTRVSGFCRAHLPSAERGDEPGDVAAGRDLDNILGRF